MQNDLILKSIQSLFPNGSAWRGVYQYNSDFLLFLTGIAVEFARAKLLGDQIPLDFLPDTTELIDEWELTFGLTDPTLLNETQRRARLTGRWRNFFQGSMQSNNMENIFALSGFDVQIRVLNPGEDPNSYTASTDYLLVNGDFQTIKFFTAVFGTSNFGTTVFGDFGNYVRQQTVYIIPTDSDFWGMIYIIEAIGGGVVDIPAELEETFFKLAYQTKPLFMWAIARVNFI